MIEKGSGKLFGAFIRSLFMRIECSLQLNYTLRNRGTANNNKCTKKVGAGV